MYLSFTFRELRMKKSFDFRKKKELLELICKNLRDILNSALLRSLTTVTPLTPRKCTRMKSAPWSSEDTCALKWVCGRLYCWWHMNRRLFTLPGSSGLRSINVHSQLQGLPIFLIFLTSIKNNPWFLFDADVNQIQITPANSSSSSAADFLKFFTSRIDSVRNKIIG